MTFPLLAPKFCGAAYVGFVAVIAEQVSQGAISPSITITGMILAALAPTLAVVVLRLQTKGELKEIHSSVNSLAQAKDAKAEAQSKRIDEMNATSAELVKTIATLTERISGMEKKEIQIAAVKEAVSVQAQAQAAQPK